MVTDDKLIEILSKGKLIDKNNLAEAKKEAKEKKTPLSEVLIGKKLITEDDLSTIIAKFYKTPLVRLSQIQINPKVLKTISEVVAHKSNIIAFEHNDKGLKVAMSDPSDTKTVEQLKKKLGLNIETYFASASEINQALNLYKEGSDSTFHDMIPTISNAKGEDLKIAPVTIIVQKLFEYALDNRASDIHIEPYKKETIVRFRIDGVLHDIVTLPKKLHQEIVSRIKVLSRLRTDEHQAAQDGKLQIIYGRQRGDEDTAVFLASKNPSETEGKTVDVRISIAPITNGENIVMRLLSDRNRQYTLTSLGLSENDLVKINKEIEKSWGTIIIVGPTGSGKTTTLYAVLKVLNKREINITTIEDPVEYDMPGVSQIQVISETDLTFANGLRAIVRQDPDIIMVGEIRDKETAGIAINAAMTGHLVLSTLHANDAATTLPRLNQMEIEPYLIASTVNLIIAQRIVRRVCTKCLEKYQEPFNNLEKNLPTPLIEKYFKKRPTTVELTRGKGCEECHKSGFWDRIGIFEVLTVSPEIEKLMMVRATASQIAEQAAKDGMTTMLEDGLNKVIQGITTLGEVLRVTRE